MSDEFIICYKLLKRIFKVYPIFNMLDKLIVLLSQPVIAYL